MNMQKEKTVLSGKMLDSTVFLIYHITTPRWGVETRLEEFDESR